MLTENVVHILRAIDFMSFNTWITSKNPNNGQLTVSLTTENFNYIVNQMFCYRLHNYSIFIIFICIKLSQPNQNFDLHYLFIIQKD